MEEADFSGSAGKQLGKLQSLLVRDSVFCWDSGEPENNE